MTIINKQSMINTTSKFLFWNLDFFSSINNEWNKHFKESVQNDKS